MSIVDCDTPEDDDGMVIRNYFGRVPADFNERTGKSRTHRQEHDPETGRLVWVRR